MGDEGAGRGGGDRCASGICKKVQYFYRASGFFYFITKPVPVDSLFRKQARMFEAEWF